MRTTDTTCPACGEVGDHNQVVLCYPDDSEHEYFGYVCPHCGATHDMDEVVEEGEPA